MSSEPDLALYKARCAAGHEWDVWAEETDDAVHVPVRELECPTCVPKRTAVEFNEADSLA